MDSRLLLAVTLATVLAGAPAGAAKASAVTAPQQLKVGGQPFGVAIDAQRGRAYVADSTNNVLGIIELASGTTAYVETGRQPNHVVLDGGRVFVSSFTDASVTVIDTSTDRVIKTLKVGGLGLALDRVTKRLYAAGGTAIGVVDTTTLELVASIAAPRGANLWGVAVDPAASRLYVTDIANPRVLVYDEAARTPLGEIALDAPGRFALAVGGTGRLYVASFVEKAAQLSIIDGRKGELLGRVPTGGFPVAIAVDEASGIVYAASSLDHTVTSVDAGTRAVLGKANAGSQAAGLAFNPATGRLYVASSGGPRPSAKPFPDVQGVRP